MNAARLSGLAMVAAGLVAVPLTLRGLSALHAGGALTDAAYVGWSLLSVAVGLPVMAAGIYLLAHGGLDVAAFERDRPPRRRDRRLGLSSSSSAASACARASSSARSASRSATGIW